MEQLMAAAATQKALVATYKEFSVEPPAWLEGVGKLLNREISLQHADFVEKKLAEIRLKKAGLVDRLHPERKLEELAAEEEKWAALATK
jgi:hypothetical protein